MTIVTISYELSRLDFFKEQLAAANRRLDWSLKHNPNCYDNAEKGEVVSFYEWAVKCASMEAQRLPEAQKTRADNIRAMNDNELAEALARMMMRLQGIIFEENKRLPEQDMLINYVLKSLREPTDKLEK